MGEIAEAMLEGLLDEETGELIDGYAPGFPRRMSDPDCYYPGETSHNPRSGRQQANALPCPCPGCGRSFRFKGDLRQHRRAKGH
jgi:hypothetical protein